MEEGVDEYLLLEYLLMVDSRVGGMEKRLFQSEAVLIRVVVPLLLEGDVMSRSIFVISLASTAAGSVSCRFEQKKKIWHSNNALLSSFPFAFFAAAAADLSDHFRVTNGHSMPKELFNITLKEAITQHTFQLRKKRTRTTISFLSRKVQFTTSL